MGRGTLAYLSSGERQMAVTKECGTVQIDSRHLDAEKIRQCCAYPCTRHSSRRRLDITRGDRDMRKIDEHTNETEMLRIIPDPNF